MNTLRVKLILFILFWVIPYGIPTSYAATIFESALPGSSCSGCGGVSIFSGNYSDLNNPQWLGARFELQQSAELSSVGGYLALTEGSIFAGIVRLDSFSALPYGDPFNADELIYSVVIDGLPADDSSYDYRQPVSWNLDAGVYGLIFGSGLFGTSGFANMVSSPQISGNDSYFFYGNQGQAAGGAFWQQAGFTNTRFVVEGTLISTIPVPPSFWLLASGLGVLMTRKRRRITM